MRHHLLALAVALTLSTSASTSAYAQGGASRMTLTGISIDHAVADRLGADPLGMRSMTAFAGGLRASVGGGVAGTEIVARSAAGVAQAGGPTASPVTVHLTWPEVSLPTPTGRERTSVKSYAIYRFEVGAGTAGAWRQVASVPPTQHQADVPVMISQAVNGLLSVGLELQTLTFSTGTEPANGPVVNNANGASGIAEVSNVVRVITP